MENLWSGTVSGMLKDWDDELDAAETPPIAYEFPYSMLAGQFDVNMQTITSANKMMPAVSSSLRLSESMSSKKATIISDMVKDGNILKSKRTYSRRKQNPLLDSNELSQKQGKKRKEKDQSPVKLNAEYPHIEPKQKKSSDKNLENETGKISKINDCAIEKTKLSDSFVNFPKTNLTNGLKNKSLLDENFKSSEYSLFGDVDPPEGNSTNDAKELHLSSEQPSNTAYLRTRKNLRKQIDSEQSMEGKDNVANFRNKRLLALENTKSSSQKEKDSDLSLSDSDEADGKEITPDFLPPPPRTQLSLMDMVRKYSEKQNSNQVKKEASKRKRKPAAQKRCKTNKSNVIASSTKSNGNQLEDASFSFASKSINVGEKNSYDHNGRISVLGLDSKTSRTPNRNHEELSTNHYIGVNSVLKKVDVCVSEKIDQPVNLLKNAQLTPKKRPSRTTRKPKVHCAECVATQTDLERDAVLLSREHAQSSVSSSFTTKKNLGQNSSESSGQSIFKSSVSNSNFSKKINVNTVNKTDTLNLTLSKALDWGQTSTKNKHLHQNIQALVPVSFSPSINSRNSLHSQLPMTSILNSTISNVGNVNLCEQKVSELPLKPPYQTMEDSIPLNPSASLQTNQCKELSISDSESDSHVLIQRTLCLLGSDFFCNSVSKINTISKNCVVKSLEEAEDWIAKTPYSRKLTVREFCNNPNVMNVLLEFLSFCPNIDEFPQIIIHKKVYYEFPEDFQNVPLSRMLKDYVDQILLQIVPPNISPVLFVLSSESFMKFVYDKLPLKECAIMTMLFSKSEMLKLADIAARLNFVALLVIFDEFRRREIET